MPNPKPGTFALGDGTSPLVPARLAARIEAARPATWIGNAVCTLVTRFLAWRARRMTLRLLSSLDAATLRDLGISDIEFGSPWRSVRPHARLRPQLVAAEIALRSQLLPAKSRRMLRSGAVTRHEALDRIRSRSRRKLSRWSRRLA